LDADLPACENADIVFACVSGWDRTGSNVFGRVLVGIHHPNGDQKKISQTTSATSAATYVDSPSWASFNTHIKVVWAQGVTEGGSSGSALFNPDGRIVGQLHGGLSFCSSPRSPDWFVAVRERETESERDRDRDRNRNRDRQRQREKSPHAY
jgi:hypothetical protein